MTFSLNGLPQGVTLKDFTLTDTSAGYTPQGACEIHGLTVTAAKAGYIGVQATAKVGRTTYIAGLNGYVAATAPKITCNGIPVSGAIPVGAGEPLPGVAVWLDKNVRLMQRGPDIKGDFSSHGGGTEGVSKYLYSFDQYVLRQLKDDYLITVKAELRDKPFKEINVKWYETDTHEGMLRYITAAAHYRKPDTSTLENFLRFNGVAQAVRKLSADDPLFSKKSESGGKYAVFEVDEIHWVKKLDDTFEAAPLSVSINWGLTSSMPLGRMVDSTNGAQYVIVISQGKEFDGVYSYQDKAGNVSSVSYYQYYYTAELFDNSTGELKKTLYREDTSGQLQPEDRLFVGAEDRGGFAGGIEAAHKKCREAVMQYIYETMWQSHK